MKEKLVPDQDDDLLLALSTQIVASYVTNNIVDGERLPTIVRDVITALGGAAESVSPKEERPVPAVNPKKSVFKDHIVCLEDGQKMKMLRRHLRTAHDMSPDEYRQRWGLPADYPMTAATYAAMRSDMAKDFGLGRKPAELGQPTVRRSTASEMPRPAESTAETPAESTVGASTQELAGTATRQDADPGRQKKKSARAGTKRAAPLRRRSPRAKR